MAQDKDFLGKGWSFPPRFDRQKKSGHMVEAEQDIEQSLKILLSTRIGERFLQPEFGCNLEDLLFESLDLTTKKLVEDRIKTAVLYYEARIDLENVSFVSAGEAEGRLAIDLTYRVRATNSRYNMVIPYFELTGARL